MSKPNSMTIDEKQYYNSKDLVAYNPGFYYGCKSKPRTIIKKKKYPFNRLHLRQPQGKKMESDHRRMQKGSIVDFQVVGRYPLFQARIHGSG